MKLPSIIRVGAFDFRVEEWPSPAASAERKWGATSFTECVIRVQVVDRPPMFVLDTLIHEINHVIFWAYQLQDGDKEERIVGVMASGWAQVYRDNPGLLEFIADAINPYSSPQA